MSGQLRARGLVLVRGAGELATGVAWRLHRAGFAVIMTEVARPLAVRRTVAFSSAVSEGSITVDGLTAVCVADPHEARAVVAAGTAVPVLVDPEATCRKALQPSALVDAIMAKRNLGTAITDAPLVIALGPGFTAGVDCHAVVETMRGHDLGRVYCTGSALPDTGIPAERGGHGADRVVRAPRAGQFFGRRRIGEPVTAGELLGFVDDQPVPSPLSGMLRGLIADGTGATAGMKIGDVDPLSTREHCFTISDKALAVAGGVLEVLCAHLCP